MAEVTKDTPFTPDDDCYHTQGDNPLNLETNWWCFNIPERRIGCWLHAAYYQNLNDVTWRVFVWDDKGHIVTNYHVVQPVAEGSRGSEITVTLQDQNLAGTLVGIAPELDLAVIRVETAKRDLKPLAVGASANLEVGQKVFAIGNPFGLDPPSPPAS